MSDELLARTLSAAVQDAQTSAPGGREVSSPLWRAFKTSSPTYADGRGALIEMIDPRWDVIEEPLTYAYATSVVPGTVKGWALHKLHNDRYFLLRGEAEVVLYDVRPDSPTRGQISRVSLPESDRGLLLIPKFVWHALANAGSSEVLLVNFPTLPYDHANPDKYRLPIDTDLIPHSFGGRPGW